MLKKKEKKVNDVITMLTLWLSRKLWVGAERETLLVYLV